MIYTINPTKDATLYSNSSSMNTGLDEILEVAKVMMTGTSRYLNRALLQFDITSFPATIISQSVAGQRTFVLKLYATEPENLKSDYTINVLAVSGSWTMGQGKRFNTPQTKEGVSWDYRTTYTTDSGSTSNWWYVSASVGQHNDYYGGQWQLTPICSQSFSYSTADADVDVTQIVEQWIAGGFPNNGFIVKFPDSYEGIADVVSYGTLKFFSKDSNTVYKPKLALKYNDAVTSSGVPVSGTLVAEDSVVYIRGEKPQYNVQSIDRIRVIARDRFPQRSFVYSQSQYVTFNYLPTSSYYGVKDAYTGEMVVDYDTQYGKLSSDSDGNFFNFYFGQLFVGRLYKFMFKVQRGSLTQYFDSDMYFKVTK